MARHAKMTRFDYGILVGVGLFLGLVGSVFALGEVAHRRGDRFGDRVVAGRPLRVWETIETKSYAGLYRCESLAFTPSSDSTQTWPFQCEDRVWGDRIVGYCRGAACTGSSRITIKGALPVLPGTPVGRVSGWLRGYLIFPVDHRRGFTNTRSQVRVPLDFRVISPEELHRLMRTRFTIGLSVCGALVLLGALLVLIGVIQRRRLRES